MQEVSGSIPLTSTTERFEGFLQVGFVAKKTSQVAKSWLEFRSSLT
jgi:hypothetical protein